MPKTKFSKLELDFIEALVSTNHKAFNEFLLTHGKSKPYQIDFSQLDEVSAKAFIKKILESIIEETNRIQRSERLSNAGIIAKRSLIPGGCLSVGLGLIAIGSWVSYLASEMPSTVSVSCDNPNAQGCDNRGESSSHSISELGNNSTASNSTTTSTTSSGKAEDSSTEYGYEDNGIQAVVIVGAVVLYIAGLCVFTCGSFIGAETLSSYKEDQKSISNEKEQVNHLIKLVNILTPDKSKHMLLADSIESRDSFVTVTKDIQNTVKDLLRTLESDGNTSEKTGLLFKPKEAFSNEFLKSAAQALLKLDRVKDSDFSLEIIIGDEEQSSVPSIQ